MGADGAATLGSLGQQTIRQPVRKLASIDKKIIVGVSGHVGLGQRITGAIEELWNGNKLGGGQKSYQVMTVIRGAIGPHIVSEMQHASEVARLLGQGIASQSAISFSVVALRVDEELRLYQFGCAGEPEEATDSLPFVSVGSGQARADPFLALIRQVFWRNGLPTLSQGIFATVWSLVHAIRTAPGGVAEPIQLMTLTQDGKRNPIVEELDDSELEEHRQAVNEAEDYISKFTIGPFPPSIPAPPAN